jgi:TolA-binding protein
MVKHCKTFGLPLLLALATAGSFVVSAFAAEHEHATLIREESLYVAAGANAEKVAQVGRGSNLVVLERTSADSQPWLKVLVTLEQGTQTREITGWLPGKTVIAASTANGDEVVFGQAVDSERQAEERGGRKGAAEDALRLYSRVPELFPGSPLAAEAMWRAADIRWQLAKQGFARSGKPLEDKYLKEVITKFPQSTQAELAEFDLLESKLCAEWRGQAECPTKESALYEQYAHEHPQSPKAAEALYDAAWRQAALTDIYRIDNDRNKSEVARKKATALAQEIQSQHADSDWKARAQDLSYKLEKKISIYSAAVDAGDTK